MTETKPEASKLGNQKPGQPQPAQSAQPAQPSQPAQSSSGAPTSKPNQAIPDRGDTLRSRVEEEVSNPTSGSTPQEYRVPGVQYPASSNQLPEDWEERETPVQKAEREQAERVQELNDNSSDLLTAAGSTSDAGVQQLLAARAIAEQNADEDGVRYADAQLAERLNA